MSMIIDYRKDIDDFENEIKSIESNKKLNPDTIAQRTDDLRRKIKTAKELSLRQDSFWNSDNNFEKPSVNNTPTAPMTMHQPQAPVKVGKGKQKDFNVFADAQSNAQPQEPAQSQPQEPENIQTIDSTESVERIHLPSRQGKIGSASARARRRALANGDSNNNSFQSAPRETLTPEQESALIQDTHTEESSIQQWPTQGVIPEEEDNVEASEDEETEPAQEVAQKTAQEVTAEEPAQKSAQEVAPTYTPSDQEIIDFFKSQGLLDENGKPKDGDDWLGVGEVPHTYHIPLMKHIGGIIDKEGNPTEIVYGVNDGEFPEYGEEDTDTVFVFSPTILTEQSRQRKDATDDYKDWYVTPISKEEYDDIARRHRQSEIRKTLPEAEVTPKMDDQEWKFERRAPRNYAEMLSQFFEKPLTREEKAKLKKREAGRQLLASLGEGLSSIANLIGTTQGAPSWYDHDKSHSEKLRKWYEKLDENRKAHAKEYYNAWARAIAQEEAATKADDAMEAKVRAHNANVRYKKNYLEQQKALKKAELEEKKRYHKAQEAIDSKKADAQLIKANKTGTKSSGGSRGKSSGVGKSKKSYGTYMGKTYDSKANYDKDVQKDAIKYGTKTTSRGKSRSIAAIAADNERAAGYKK